MNPRVLTEMEHGVATVRLDAPPLNAFDSTMRKELTDAVAALEVDDSLRVVVLWGGPSCFAAGADIDQLMAMGFELIVHWNRALQQTFTRFAELSVPVVAAINGFALGGGMELALCADYRIAGRGASLGQPEVLLGIMPGSGGTQRLRALVGPSRAKELLMSGRRLRAEDAAALGLVDEVVSDECVHDRALQYARRLAAGPRFALSAIKEAVDHAGGPAGLALERALIAGLFATEDRARGMRSFIEHGPGRAEFG